MCEQTSMNMSKNGPKKPEASPLLTQGFEEKISEGQGPQGPILKIFFVIYL